MNTTIIDFNNYKKNKYFSSHSHALNYEKDLETFDNYVQDHAQFSKDYTKLLQKLQTKNHEFMFPTVLHKYKRGINPVYALYYCTQESLIKYNQQQMYEWVLNLFDDDKWYNKLINSIKTDIANISAFCKKYANISSEYIQSKIKELNTMKEKFKHFLEVFMSLKDWKRDNLKH